jgi:hypothetical protein
MGKDGEGDRRNNGLALLRARLIGILGALERYSVEVSRVTRARRQPPPAAVATRRLLERVEEADAAAFKIARVARNEGEMVGLRGRGD